MGWSTSDKSWEVRSKVTRTSTIPTGGTRRNEKGLVGRRSPLRVQETDVVSDQEDLLR